MRNPKWLTWAQRIQSIAQAGLEYSKDPYDLERFAELREIAVAEVGARVGLRGEDLVDALALEPEGGFELAEV